MEKINEVGVEELPKKDTDIKSENKVVLKDAYGLL